MKKLILTFLVTIIFIIIISSIVYGQVPKSPYKWPATKPLGPTVGTAYTSYEYSTMCTGPAGTNGYCYQISWGDSMDTICLVGGVLRLRHSWRIIGNYNVMARCIMTPHPEYNDFGPWSNPLTVKIFGGGGCPILKAFDGNEFKEIELLNIHATKDQDTTYTSSFSMQPINDKYELILHEAAYLFWDGSHINSIKLVDSSGKECILVSAVHSKQGDVLSAISYSDNVRVRSYPGEEIKLVYDGCSGNDFTFTIEGYNMKTPYFTLPYLLSDAVVVISLIIVIIEIIVIILIIKKLSKQHSKKRRK